MKQTKQVRTSMSGPTKSASEELKKKFMSREDFEDWYWIVFNSETVGAAKNNMRRFYEACKKVHEQKIEQAIEEAYHEGVGDIVSFVADGRKETKYHETQLRRIKSKFLNVRNE